MPLAGQALPVQTWRLALVLELVLQQVLELQLERVQLLLNWIQCSCCPS